MAMAKTRKRKKRKRGQSGEIVRRLKQIAVLTAILLLTIYVPSLFWNRPGVESGDKVPKGDYLYGIDVSHHNGGRFVWDSLRVMTDNRGRTVRSISEAYDIKPVSFVFIKATEGVSMKDSDFRKNWKESGKAGLRRGAYHFFRSSKDGNDQAAHFIATVGDLSARDLPPVLDIESIHLGCSRELLNERALQWLRAVEKRYGRKPIVYSGASFARDNLSREITDNYEIWIAHYGTSSPAFDGWTYWQFTDKAVVYGVPGHVDLSVRKVRK